MANLSNQCPHCKYVSSVFWQTGPVAKIVTCPACGWTVLQAPSMSPSTQKAKGILALMRLPRLSHSVQVVPILKLLKASDVITTWPQGLREGPVFARPCPPSPEHGFVESRCVSSWEALEQVRQETFAANEQSEIMLMNPIDAALNCVWTPSLFAIGPGHDGATAGKGAIAIPLAGINPLPEEIITASGIAEGAGPYIEAVLTDKDHTGYGGHSVFLTQLRGGPVLASGISPDFIPSDMMVEEVIQTNGEDLLEWARVVRKLAGKPGVIVYHPGGVLTDHYSVHCRENGVSMVTTYRPAVGEVINANTVLPPLDPLAMREGLIVGDRIPLNRLCEWVELSLIALHHSSVMRGPHAFWVGVAVSTLIRLGAAALEAEGRHAHECYQGMKTKPNIYAFYTAKGLNFLRARLSRITQLLTYGFGDVDGPHGYGGPKWGLCGAGLCPLFDAVRRLTLDPSEDSARDMVLALNIAINQAHNGGWWLNKFIDATAYDRAPTGSLDIVFGAAGAFWAAHQFRATITQDMRDHFVKQVSRWPEETRIKPLKWRHVDLRIGCGSFVLDLKAATVPKTLQITIPATKAVMTALLKKLGRIEIRDGAIDLIPETGNPQVIWREKPLAMAARGKSTWRDAV